MNAIGLFDVLSTPVAWLASLVRASGGTDLVTVCLLGIAGGVVSMAIYRLISPQQRLATLGIEIREARSAVIDYDGEMEGMLVLIRRVLGMSLRQLWLSGWPAVLASLPVLFVAMPLSSLFDYAIPRAGDLVELTVLPAREAARLTAVPAANLAVDAATGIHLRWPATGHRVQLRVDGRPVLELPGDTLSPVIGRYGGFNRLLANPNGYLPEQSTIERIEIGYRARALYEFGPDWMRVWWLPFFAVLVVTSLLLKWRWKIH